MKFGWRLLASLALALVLGAGLLLAFESRAAVERINHVLDLLRGSGLAGYFGFALIQALVATIGIVPASLMGIAAGLTYGLWTGFVLAAAGTMLGGWLAFLLSRSMFRPWIAAFLEKRGRMANFDRALGEGSWRLVCLIRISPVMPFSMTSYALGMTRIDQRSYMLGTLASMPALLAYVATGAFAHSTLSAAVQGDGYLRLVPLGIGVIATAVATFHLRKLVIGALSTEPALP